MLLTLVLVVSRHLRVSAQHCLRHHDPGSLALPFTILGTFAVMATLDYGAGQHVDDGADPCAIGFVVDDAIVMLENIVRHIELGAAAV